VAVPLELDGHVFVGGRSTFLDAGNTPETTSKIFVKVLPAALPVPILAQLGTGAAWTVPHTEIADALCLFERTGPAVAVSTRGGPFHGSLVRLPLTLVADEGESFEVDATLFACRDWPTITNAHICP